MRRGLGQVLADGICERACTPDEHAAVPEIIFGFQEFLGLFRVGLLGETADTSKRFSRRLSGLLAGFDVTVSGFGSRGLNTHDDHVGPARAETGYGYIE